MAFEVLALRHCDGGKRVKANYIVFYRVGNSAIEVIRVLHGRRDVDAIFSRNEES